MNDQRYNLRGVSASKEDVHNAIKNIDKGIFPKAFCKIIVKQPCNGRFLLRRRSAERKTADMDMQTAGTGLMGTIAERNRFRHDCLPR